MSAFVDDTALNRSASILMASTPYANKHESTQNKNTTDESELCIDGKCPEKFMQLSKNYILHGDCLDEICSGNASKICVMRNENTSYLDEKEVNGVPVQRKYTLYDGTRVIGNLKGGKHLCWSKEPGRTFLHINEGPPAYFKAHGGKIYYFDSTMKAGLGGWWGFSSIISEEMKSKFLVSTKAN